MREDASYNYQADIAIGTPPQNTSFQVSIRDSAVLPLVQDCVFCPTEGMFNSSHSSTFQRSSERSGTWSFGGLGGSETLTLGRVLQDRGSPMIFIDHMGIEYTFRMSGGVLGLAPTLNETLRKQNFLARLDEQGQLLNPVWGLRLGGDDPRLTIGALDPEDYQGEINWVPELQDDGKIEIDAFKGYQGNVLDSFEYPVIAGLSS
ncbi:hypothetical protein V5O48_007297, partial [Marasmius crinis-equi]